jgi:hypothetical protein
MDISAPLKIMKYHLRILCPSNTNHGNQQRQTSTCLQVSHPDVFASYSLTGSFGIVVKFQSSHFLNFQLWNRTSSSDEILCDYWSGVCCFNYLVSLSPIENKSNGKAGPTYFQTIQPSYILYRAPTILIAIVCLNHSRK